MTIFQSFHNYLIWLDLQLVSMKKKKENEIFDCLGNKLVFGLKTCCLFGIFYDLCSPNIQIYFK